jgi:hypothetical protein
MYSTNFDYEEKLILKLQSSFSSFLQEILIIHSVKFEVANPLYIFDRLFPNKKIILLRDCVQYFVTGYI